MKLVIHQLYRAFGSYRLGRDFAGCSHCVDPAATARLAKADLRSLMLADLDHYAFKAMTTWGDVGHFKHFLPRLFEIAAEEFENFHSPEVLFNKLSYGRYDKWPKSERLAVNDYLTAFWDAVLTSEARSAYTVDTALCCLGNASMSVQPYLNQWASNTTPAAVKHLAEFVLVNASHIKKHQTLMNAYWTDRPSQSHEVISWLRSSSIYECLRNRQDDLRPELSSALAALVDL